MDIGCGKCDSCNITYKLHCSKNGCDFQRNAYFILPWSQKKSQWSKKLQGIFTCCLRRGDEELQLVEEASLSINAIGKE
jgi:hypothetical protein